MSRIRTCFPASPCRATMPQPSMVCNAKLNSRTCFTSPLSAMSTNTSFERYFLLVVDDYSRYTTVFPLRRKGEVTEGIRQTFTLPASPQQNGIAECRIGMVMDVARTSMIHAAAPHFLWPFAVQYAAHQINLQPPFVCVPRTSCPLVPFPASSLASPLTNLGGSFTTPPRVVFCPLRTSRLTSRYLTTVSFPTKLPLSPPPPLFLAQGAPPVDPLPPHGPAPSGVSQVDPVEPVEVVVDSGVARGAEPAGAGIGSVEPGGAESGGTDPGGAELEGAEPRGAESGGAEPGGAEPERAESGGPPGVPSRREPLSPQQLREWYTRCCRRATRGAAGAEAVGGASRAAGGTARAGAAGAVGPGGADAEGTGAVGGPAGVGAAGGARVVAGDPGRARTGGTGAVGACGSTGFGAVGAGAVAIGGAIGAGAAGGTGAGGATGVVAGDPRAEGTGAVFAVSGGSARPRLYYVPLIQQVLGLPPSSGPPPPLLSPPRVQSQSQLQPASPLPGPSPYSGPTRGLTEPREPESRPASPKSRPASPESRPESPISTGRRVPRQRPPPVPGTHSMTLRPSTATQRVPLPSPPASSLPALADPESDSLRTASPTITRLLTTVATDPSFESTAAFALVAELVDFAAHCRLDYAARLVAESESASVCPPSVGGEYGLGTDVLEDRQEEFECFAAAVAHLVSMLLAPEGDPDAPDIPTPRSYAEAIEGPYSSQWQAAMDAEMASWKSTGTYIE
ncbi:unnamed protein product [Closterium sp. NIES-54]